MSTLRTLRPVPNGPFTAPVACQTRPEAQPRQVAPLRLVGAVALPDGRDALVCGDDIQAIWDRSLELVDAGQPVQPEVVAVTNGGGPRAA